MTTASKVTRSNRRNWLMILIIVLALYVIVPQLGAFKSSWQLFGKLEPAWLLIAGCLTLMTYLAAAGTYYFLAFKQLRYSQLVLVEVAAMFINRLVPAGIGALGTNYSYLRRRGHNQAQAATMVAANNVIGVVGHLFLVFVALALSAQVKLKGIWHGQPPTPLLAGTAIAAMIIAV